MKRYQYIQPESDIADSGQGGPASVPPFVFQEKSRKEEEMCGIAGEVRFDGGIASVAAVAAASEAHPDFRIAQFGEASSDKEVTEAIEEDCRTADLVVSYPRVEWCPGATPLIGPRALLARKPDVVVEAVVTNTGPRPATLLATAFAPGYPLGRTSISELPPGGQVVRWFPYPGGAEKLRGARVVVSLAEADGAGRGARLNKSVEIAE